MRCVMVREHGDYDALRLEETGEPLPGPGEVQVALKASGLNHLDTWVRRGVPGHRFPLPMIPGCDGAGVVSALGAGVADLALGDEVVLAPGVSCGRCARTSRTRPAGFPAGSRRPGSTGCRRGGHAGTAHRDPCPAT